jgi:Dynamin central region
MLCVALWSHTCKQDIRTAICNANGTRPSLFVPEMSFDLLVRKQIARLEQPGLQANTINIIIHTHVYTVCAHCCLISIQSR